jgi:hypothetical protein
VINRLMFAIQIRMLAQHRIPADEPPYLRVVVARPDVQQPRMVAPSAVACLDLCA